MKTPPRDRLEFVIRFACSFLFFGTITGMAILFNVIDKIGMAPSVACWAVASIIISYCAAKVGDKFWHEVLSYFHFWP